MTSPRDDMPPDRNLALELVRVTEAAALAAARVVGMGDKEGADQAAVDAMRHMLDSVHMNGVVVIGEGENLKYFTALNKEYGWFETVEALAHPRFIMQYKLKFKQDYIGKYLATFKKYTGV